MQGALRTFNKETLARVKERVRTICTSIAEAHECTAEVKLIDSYPAVVNHKEQTDCVIRLAKKFIGEENFSQDELPLLASEDFSFFTQEKPGCYFMLGSMQMDKQLMTVHTSNFDYNDNLLATCGYFLLRIIEDRFALKLIK